MMENRVIRSAWCTVPLLTLCMPILWRSATICLGLVFLGALVSNFSKDSQRQSKQWLPFVMVIPFLIAALGMANTQNIDSGSTKLVLKSVFVAMPVIIVIAKWDWERVLPVALKYFLIGCLISCIVNIGLSTANFIKSHDPNEFFYVRLAHTMHPSYLSMYLGFSIMFLYYFLFNPRKSYYVRPKIAMIGVVFITLMIMLLSSKMGLVAMLVVHIGALVYYVVNCKKYTQTAVVGMLGILTSIAAYLFVPSINSRINEMADVFSDDKGQIGNSTTAVRIHASRVALELIENNAVFGVGTGDGEVETIKAYERNNLVNLAERRLNLHNQFLETFVANGVVGFLVLLGLLVLPFAMALPPHLKLFRWFAIVLALNLLSESMLERQAGVTFFAIFTTLFLATYSDYRKRVVGSNLNEK